MSQVPSTVGSLERLTAEINGQRTGINIYYEINLPASR